MPQTFTPVATVCCWRATHRHSPVFTACSALDRLNTDDVRELISVPVSVKLAEQLNVAILVDIPVVLQICVFLRHQVRKISEKSCRAPISVDERMDPHGLGVHRDTENTGRDILDVFPPVADCQRRTKNHQ